jgi:Tol biopolymer transport system component
MRRWLSLTLVTLLFVAACSGNQPVNPWGDLQAPGLRKIPGIEALQPLSAVARVYHAVTYQSTLDANTTHVLFEVGQTVYDMRLDGSQLRPLSLPCSESVAVAPGGGWIACQTNTDIVIHDMSDRDPDVTLTDAGEYAGLPTWAPDGRHLAVVTKLDGGCSIGIFDIALGSQHPQRVALLSLPRFTVQVADSIGCSVTELTWSPDGTQLAFIDRTEWAVYDLPIGSLHLLTRSSTLPLITRVLTGDQMARLGGKCSSQGGLAWTASSKALTYVDFYGRTITQVDIGTADTTTVLAQHAADVFSLSWTPDGSHLLFVLGLTSDELTVPPSQLYVYTPSDA